MKQFWKVVPALGLLLGVGGVANADVAAFSCTATGDFLSIVDAPNSDGTGFTGPYGDICVSLIDNNTAFIQAETFAPYGMVDGNALDLNVAGGGTLVGSITAVGGVPPFTVDTSTHQVDGLGKFNFSISDHDASVAATFLSFTIDRADLLTWSNAGQVLVFNAAGFDAGMHVNVAGTQCPAGGSPCTFFAGENTEGTVIGETPEPAVLSLLGIALVAMGFGRRRKA